MRKATASPEGWGRYLAYQRKYRQTKLEKERARLREYNSRPEVKDRRRVYDARPERRARKLAKSRTPEAKEKARLRFQKRCQDDPTLLVQRRAWHREYRTGFDDALVAALLAIQDNRCAVCRAPFDKKRMHADHCHATGKPRGLLCIHCNLIDGMISRMGLNAVEFGHRLVAYLAMPPASIL